MVFDGLQRALFPPVCLICGQAGRVDVDCCAGCEAELPRLSGRCDRCGLELDCDRPLCGRCSMALPSFDATWPAFAYQNEIEKLIHRFKFHADLASGRLLGQLLARRLKDMNVPRPDVIMPVPLHIRRLFKRGFNQSALLCRDLAAEMDDLPWVNGLRRVRDTATQIHLPADRRAANVRGAFKLARLPESARSVVLVDDVMTTGSTLNECARVLRKAGVERVEVWVVARA
jgi:ComF family protein